jgi:uncharacterized protein with PQ loop repeat
MEQIQLVAGSIAGLIFAAASWNMLVKAWRTKDLRSYSLGQIVLNNVGNLFYWMYILSLPFGPIWLMHAFFTLASLVMLVWYFVYRTAPKTAQPTRRVLTDSSIQPSSGHLLRDNLPRRSRQQEGKCF